MYSNKSIKVCVVKQVHGDEGIDVRIPAGVDVVIGNDYAVARGKRFVDADLNRVFPGKCDGNSEEQRAAELVELLAKYDVVIDLHTTKAVSEPFFIVTSHDTIELITTDRLSKVCVMSPEVALGKALIYHCKGFSIEMHEDDDPKVIELVIEDIVNRVEKKNAFEVYEVFDVVFEDLKDLVNFELYEGRFFPVLAGETDYEFCCLAARKKH